ncbi:AAA family ATPase [bacterium]|nr:AAA family ATPase [bacterium]
MNKSFTNQEIANLFFEGLGRTTSIIVADSDDRVIYINDWYANLLELPKDEIIGKSIRKIIPNTYIPEIRKMGNAEVRLFTMSNGERVVSSYIPLVIGKEVVGVLSYNANTIDHMNTVATTEMVLRLNAELNQFKNEVVKLRSAKYSLNSIIGSSAKIMEIKELVQKVARTKSTVLIMGETGTGKELFAHAIHQESPRNKQSFIALNCAALPKDLIEAELFGYEYGAFSGARKEGNPGKFELAHMGTLYLDEIDQIPQALQSKLLRAIQEKEIERVGGTKIIKTDVRLVCTSNKDLEDLVNKGEFRKDLYYRINVLSLRIPPLRERLEDIPDLVKHFLKKINKDLGLNVQKVHPDVLKAFQRHTWPGNVRELEHLLEGSANIALSGTLNVFHFQNFMPQFFELMDSKRVNESMNLNNLKAITD